MGKVVAYKCDDRMCYCNIKLESGENILISIGGGTVVVYKCIFFGAVPVVKIYSGDNLYKAYAKFASVPTDEQLEHPCSFYWTA